MKTELTERINDSENAISDNPFGANNVGWITIPKEWERGKYKKAENTIKEAENKFCEQYDLLIKTGRRILKI